MTTPRLGIFARVFPVGSADEVAAAIAGAGYELAHLNLRAIGLPTIPPPGAWDAIDPPSVAARFGAAGVACWGVSCTFNLAHPDASVRDAGVTSGVELIRRAPEFGAGVVTLCSGSRNRDSMWAFHPDNAGDAAWRDMRAGLDILITAAREAGVVLGIEPEPGNVVRDAVAARRLLIELGTDAKTIGIVADAANLLTGVPADHHHAVLERSFTDLADHIICLHAKDLVPWSATLAGQGAMDYGHVAALYQHLGLRVPVIVQDVLPGEASAARAFLQRTFESVPARDV